MRLQLGFASILVKRGAPFLADGFHGVAAHPTVRRMKRQRVVPNTGTTVP